MFYGGSLLSSLTADDPGQGKDQISLKALNRYMAVLIDSDKSSESANLNSTKKRIIAELAVDETGSTWVTEGYTIENYVPSQIMQAVRQSVHPKVQFSAIGSLWDNPLKLAQGSTVVDKVEIARRVCENWTDKDWSPHPKEKIADLILMIRRANVLH
jgi:hypothetical protein